MKNVCLLSFLLLVASLTLASEEPVAGTWSMAQNGKQRQGWYTGGRALTGAKILWSNMAYTAAGRLWGGAPKIGSPVTDEQHVYIPGGAAVGNANHNVMALDINTGAKVWGQALDAIHAFGTPVVSSSRVYVATVNDAAPSTIACLNKADGTIIWTSKVDNLLAGGLLLVNGKLIFGSKWNNSGLHCLDADTGTQIWKAALGTVSFWPDSGPALSPDGQVVYVRHNGADDPSDFIAALDLNTGTTIWQILYPKAGAGTEALQPLVDNTGNIYCGFQGISAAAEPDVVIKFGPSGTTLWTYTFAGDVWEQRGGLALSPDQSTLYVAHNGSSPGITALNTANGSLKWFASTGKIHGNISVGKDNIIMGLFNSAMGAVARAIKDTGASGVTLWEVVVSPMGDGWLAASGGNPCILTNGDLVVATDYGVIARLTYEPAVSPTSKLLLSSAQWWGGTASVSPPGAWFLTGSVLTLTATPTPGNRFTGWSGSIASSQNPLVLTVGVGTITITANFAPLPKPFVDGQVWENFNTLWYSDGTWWGPAPNSEIRQLFFTNIDGRSCLAYHLIDSGSNAQLHTEFGMYPHEFSNNTDFVVELWAPALPAEYTIRSLCKHDGDADHAMGLINITADGWKTIAGTMTVPEMPASLLWWLIGGFPPQDWHSDKALPAGQTCTFFFDRAYFAGGTAPAWIVDEFEINPSCVGHENWQQRPRNWRYDTGSDYSTTYQNRNYSAFGVDPTGVNRTGLCLVLPFEAFITAEPYARAWTSVNQPIYADLSNAGALEADLLLLCTNAASAPVRFWFSDGAAEATTAPVNVPTGGWTRLSWTMPTSPIGWTNISRIGVMITTTDAGQGILCVDNITFFVPEPSTLALLLGLTLWVFRKR
ncbi:MAG: PQQ-binding-like beta-propeller repeat protein [bacterium]|nr:PQQ-binding-like beta-propeller repeat protein [bacterium]